MEEIRIYDMQKYIKHFNKISNIATKVNKISNMFKKKVITIVYVGSTTKIIIIIKHCSNVSI